MVVLHGLLDCYGLFLDCSLQDYFVNLESIAYGMVSHEEVDGLWVFVREILCRTSGVTISIY